jgi:hypothetical protein
VRLNVSVSGKLRDVLAQKGIALQDAGNAAVVRQTQETHGEMRVQIAQRLSPRAANALRSRRFVNPSTVGGEGEVVGFINSAWFRKSRATGQNIDMFAAFERGDVIRPVRGKFLAVPLPAAYTVAGIGGRNGARPTVEAVETALDQDLFPITRPGRPTLLFAKQVSLGRGRGAKIRAPRGRNARGGFSRRRTVNAIIPLFVLLKNTKLPKRLDFTATRAKHQTRLAEKFLVELARREAR